MTSWYNGSLNNKVSKFVEVAGRTAAELLDDREVIEELKKSNPRLLEYIASNASLHPQLLEFVTQMPTTSDSSARQFKYPMVACELLQEVPPLLQMGFTSDESTHQFFGSLFGVLNSKEAVGSLLSSYFARVFEAVCRGQLYGHIIKYLRTYPSIVDVLIRCGENPSLLRCLKWLIIVDDKDGYEVERWCEFKLEVFSKAFEGLKNSLQRDPFLVESLLELLTELVQRHMMMYHKHELLASLLEPSRVALLLEIAIGKEAYSIAAVRLLTELVVHSKNVEGMEAAASLEGFFAQFQACFGELVGQIDRPSLKSLELMEMLAQSLRLKRRVVSPAHFPVLNSLLDLMVKHQECNLLHCKLERIIYAVFEQPENQDLIDYLFKEADIIGRTVGGLKFEDRFRSHFGFIIRMAKRYSTSITETPSVKEGIKRNELLWANFSKSVLEPYLTSLSKDLGSYAIEEKDNTNATNLFTVKSFVKNMPEPHTFRVQQASCIEQAPTSLISLDFIGDSNEIIPLDEGSSTFGLSFDRPAQQPIVLDSKPNPDQGPPLLTKQDTPEQETQTPSASSVATTLPPPPSGSMPPGYVPGGISATKSFEDFMKKKREEMEGQGSKSRTPTKTPAVNTSGVEPNSGSARKRNRWQSADQPPQEPPKPSVKESSGSKIQLPVIHLFKIRKPEGHPVKTRKICMRRDQNLKLVLDTLNSLVVSQ